MDELKANVAKNIAANRKRLNLTQLQLAEKLNYSDKAVSKWERAEAVPDVYILQRLAEIFGITVDELIGSPTEASEKTPAPKNRKVIISLLSVGLVWLIATVAFVALVWAGVEGRKWLAFLYAIPVSAIVGIVFSAMWGKRAGTTAIVSLLIWSIALAVLLTFPKTNVWLIFIIGIPLQALAVLWYFLKRNK